MSNSSHIGSRAIWAEVALPLPFRKTFSYWVPEEMRSQIAAGFRVEVPFRKKRETGVVLSLHDSAPPVPEVEMKSLYRLVDDIPVFTSHLLDWCRWVADYYFAPLGEVLHAACPLGKVRGAKVVREVQLAGQAAERLANMKLTDAQRRIVERFHEDLNRKVSVAELLKHAHASPSVLETLVKKGVVEIHEHHAERRAHGLGADRSALDARALSERYASPFTLTADQKRACRILREAIERSEFSVLLLFGVTASGKTEVYLRSIEAVLAQGRTSLLLVPEIALTPSAVEIFQHRFGEQVAVLHSGLSDGERYDEWWRIKRGQARVVVGTRSAVFAPLEDVGLIIVDEEQEATYKQQDSPRYHARDIAIVRARNVGAAVVLGSATPSMESFQNAQRGKYQLIAMETRVESRALAEVEIVDMRQEFRESHAHEVISRRLRAAIESRLQRQEQVLVLLNRRGYSSFVVCRKCGRTEQCRHCSITLTYHKRRDILLCHYCGSSFRVPTRCPDCHSEHLHFVGEGTEQVEERLRTFFPMARIDRMDRDTTARRESHFRILKNFAAGVTDILVGTQMIAKGHDFPRVTLVGVIQADAALALPDFRAAERTFQLLTQVAGRAGRGDTPGEVILQSYYPEHYAIRFAAKQNFIDFYNKEIHFRRMLHYAPFVQLAQILVRDRQFERAQERAEQLAEHLRGCGVVEARVLGPAMAPLARLKNEYRWQILLKARRREAMKRLLTACQEFCAEKKFPPTAVLIDVDPLTLM